MHYAWYCKFMAKVYSEVVLTNQRKSVKETKMNRSVSLYKDVLTGAFFLAGIFSFVSGQFVISTMLFGASSLSSNLGMSPVRI